MHLTFHFDPMGRPHNFFRTEPHPLPFVNPALME